jgi:N-acetyl-gamma-glutamyl-phosphate reductase
MNNIKVGIIGGAGYTGGELLRLLLNHPYAEIVFVHSNSNSGKYVHQVHNDLLGETSLKFSAEKDFTAASVLFLCVGHGEAEKFLANNEIEEDIKIIDLSQDFRLKQKLRTCNRTFTYGLPELNKEEIKVAQNVANPGCFATAIQLGLLPLAKAGILGEVYATGITGSTGAGQSLSASSHFSWRANNVQAYKALSHQHINEIHQSLNQLQSNLLLNPREDGGYINFIPWRGDFTRGIFISSQSNCNVSEAELNNLYEDFYKDHPFVVLSKDAIYLKQVVNTNKCVIQTEKIGKRLVVHSAIDNLLKGASGQAVQNMNLMFGIDETSGLKLKAIGF